MCNPDQFCDSDKLHPRWFSSDGLSFGLVMECDECGRAYQSRRVFTDGADADIYMRVEVEPPPPTVQRFS